MHDSSHGPVGGITVIESPEATTARLWGEIDEALRGQASVTLGRALERDLPIVLDTREVTFIDSAGVAFLIQLCRIGREEGLVVTLLDPPEVVRDVLELLGLEHLFVAEDQTSVSLATAQLGGVDDQAPSIMS